MLGGALLVQEICTNCFLDSTPSRDLRNRIYRTNFCGIDKKKKVSKAKLKELKNRLVLREEKKCNAVKKKLPSLKSNVKKRTNC